MGHIAVANRKESWLRGWTACSAFATYGARFSPVNAVLYSGNGRFASAALVLSCDAVDCDLKLAERLCDRGVDGPIDIASASATLGLNMDKKCCGIESAWHEAYGFVEQKEEASQMGHSCAN